MRSVWKALLWVAVALVPGGLLLLPIALRRDRPRMLPADRACARGSELGD